MAALFVCGICAAQPVPKPEVKVGDLWVYESLDYDANKTLFQYEMRVVFAARGVIQVVNRRPGREEYDTTYTAEWNAVTVGPRIINPHTGWFKFPLQPGDTYKASYELIMPKKEISSRNERTVKVVGWEDLVVPAGKFRALRVVSEGRFQVIENTFRSGTSRNVIWYVPEVRRWVKWTLENRPGWQGGGRGEYLGEELVSYKLQ